MGALVRLVSLVGVMSAGFYVLYLAQGQLTQPESLTETVAENPDAPTLGAAEESPTTISAAKPNDEFPGLDSSKDPWKSAPSENVGLTKFTAKARPSETTVVTADQNAPFASDGIDFRDPTNALDEPPVMTADTTPQSAEKIVLVSNDDPFGEDLKPIPPKTEERPAESSAKKSNPFETTDPFGEDVKQPETTETKEQPSEEFDPFGSDLAPLSKESSIKPQETTTPKLKDDAFPGLGTAADKSTDKLAADKTTEETKSKEPAPFVGDDPFAPLPEEKPKSSNSPDKKMDDFPTLDEDKDDPFPTLGLDESAAKSKAPTKKPELAEDPFGDAFPETPKPEKPVEPIKEPAKSDPLDDPFPAFPGEETKAKTKTPAPTLKEDPFGDFPPLEKEPAAKETPKTPTPVLSNEPFGEEKPSPADSEKSLDDFPAFPGELDTPEKATTPKVETPTPKLEEDPFGSAFPPLEEKKTTQPLKDSTPTLNAPADDTFPEFTPLEPAGESTQPEMNSPQEDPKLDSLPPVDEFPMLDEKLKANAKEIELKPVPKVEEVPEELPESTIDSETPGGAPEGQIPSLTELQGDGVVAPDTPREMKLPYLEITKQAPPKAILNKPFVYTIRVKNVGDVAANEVTVQDQIPKGSNLTGTIPQAELVGRRLVWKLGRVEPGQEQKIAVRIVPVEPGPLGSVATVNFVAEVGAETVIEPAQVTFDMNIPADAKMGEIIDCRFTITNHGKDVVSGIILRDIIPAGLHHPAGHDLENPLGDLKPGESLTEVLQLKVMKPGRHVNEAVLMAEGGLKIRKTSILNASGNRLTVSRRGPKERFVGRPAIYQNIVINNSDQTVKNSVVVEKLPPGMQFDQADAGGQYHSTNQEIHWRIPELRPGQSIVLQSRLIPTQPGRGQSLVRVLEDQGPEIQMVSHTEIRSYASIGLAMTEFDNPILTGDLVKMRIEATNRGNVSAQNVQVRAKIPPTLELVTVRGETRFKRENRDVIFETLNALPAGETEIIELELRAIAPAPSEVAVTIQSQEMKKPLLKASAIEVHSRQ